MFVSLEKRKLLTPEFVRDIYEFAKEYQNTYTECFVLKFLDIAYCLYWCRAYETVLGMSCHKLVVALFLLFHYSHCKRLLLQSMQSSSNSRLNIN